MKQTWKTGAIAALLAVIYLFLLVGGSFLICAYPAWRQSEYVIGQATSIAQATEEAQRENRIELAQSANIYILIYDRWTLLANYAAPTTDLYNNEPALDMSRYLPTVLKGKSILHLILVRQTGRWYPDIMVVAGVPIIQDGTVTGGVFVVKNMMDVPYSMFGYLIYFSICYWITAAAILLNRWKTRRLEQLEKTYVANMTHALKTPIASIKALAETLCDGVEPDPDKQQLCCGMILTEANRQSRMVQDILDLSRLQSDSAPFPKERVTAEDLFAPVWEKYRLLFDCAGIQLHRTDSLNQLPDLATNPAHVRQVMEILLDNALKFVPEGGDVWVEASTAGRRATILVRDSGIGIASQDLPHVFDRFYKSSHNSNQQGSGLGLAIAKEICDKLQEKIWAESQPGQGASFSFTLRLCQKS